MNMLEAARNKVKELMKNNDPSHDWLHVERVYNNAMHLYEVESPLLAEGQTMDLTIIQLAALFHDVVDFKYEHSKSKSLDEIAEERLGPFFEQYHRDCTKDQKEKIIYIMMNLSWRKELESGSNFFLFLVD